MLIYLTGLFQLLSLRRETVRNERGAVSSEWVLITAGMVALAIAVIAVITSKVTAKANSIPIE